MDPYVRENLRVHVVLSDKGWILERCARELAERLNYVTYSLDTDDRSAVQYYLNYSAYDRRISPVEMAFFTHIEEDPAATERFFAVAGAVQQRIVMADRYARALADKGLSSTVIRPGVDTQTFRPKVRIGVVGRTYWTGRKGENLVKLVLDVPGIEWRFAGSGWPGPTVDLNDLDLPDFYNSVDYVLIPSLIEGGPMSAPEAIACGRPVISSDVGWMDRLPHIPYQTGNAEDLRRVLVGLVARRKEESSTALDWSWAKWAEQHDALFREAVRGVPLHRLSSRPRPRQATRQRGRSVSLLLHGDEKRHLGGPSVRVPQTAARLRRRGVDASVGLVEVDAARGDIAHIFNIWPPRSSLDAIARHLRSGTPVVFSPIYLDFSRWGEFQQVPRILDGRMTESSMADALASLAGGPIEPFPLPGYRGLVRAACEGADYLVFLSEAERNAVGELGVANRPSTVIRNAVDHERFAGASGAAFAERYGVEDYVLCVGRIEPRKNQALLARAIAETDLPVVFIGHPANDSYADLVRRLAGPRAVFVPRLEPDDDLLVSAYAGARAFCLPSFAEGAPLVALEAAAAGVPLVLGDRSAEREYFGSMASYVSPLDLRGLREAVVSAHRLGGDHGRRLAMRQFTADQFGWDKHIADLMEVYETVPAPKANPSQGPSPLHTWTVDVTTSLHHSGTPAGIARVEQLALRAIFEKVGRKANAVAWEGGTNQFREVVRSKAYEGAFQFPGADTGKEKHPESGNAVRDILLVLGNGWIRNERYVAALAELKKTRACRLVVMVHDIIQHRMRGYYGSEVAELFEKNLRRILTIADMVVTYSQATTRDLKAYCAEISLPAPPIRTIRLGDVPLAKAFPTPLKQLPATENGKLVARAVSAGYALCVSAVDARKNHRLLFDVWRRLIAVHGARTPFLLAVGRMGWNAEEIVAALSRDELLSAKVLILQDVDDALLDYLYRHAQFTVYPSLMEGWGLPVAESLAYGKICIASNASSIPEIAPSLCDLIDPLDGLGWYRRIERYFFNKEARAERERHIEGRYVPRSWTVFGAELLDASLSSLRASGSVLAAEEVLWLGSSDKSPSASLGQGWHGVERNGRWIGERATVALDLLGRSALGWTLRLALSTITSKGATRGVEVLIDGVSVATLRVEAAPREYVVPIPVDVLNGDLGLRRVQIDLRSSSTFRPNDTSDVRELSVFVRALVLSRTGSDWSALPVVAPAEPAMMPNGRKVSLLRRLERRLRKWRKGAPGTFRAT